MLKIYYCKGNIGKKIPYRKWNETHRIGKMGHRTRLEIWQRNGFSGIKGHVMLHEFEVCVLFGKAA